MFEPIAIVGMAVRVPGASDLDQFWRLVASGEDAISDLTAEQLLEAGVPQHEFDHPDYIAKNPLMPGVDLFDAEFFGMTPREADVRDPQHRVFLEVSHAAIQHAGYAPESLPGVVGVYAGGATNGYAEYYVRQNPDVSRQVGPLAVATGNHLDYLATGLAYKFDFTGPTVNVATACSTSLVALHLACGGLRAGECDVAIAGGVSLEMPYGRGYRWSPGSIVARDGTCRPFDRRASGTVFGNGCGVLVLKRLSDAVRDSDMIQAVVLGTAVGNDGAQKMSFSAPSVQGQKQVIVEAMALAGVEPARVGYVEAHGTGTLIGDPLELQALREAYESLATAPLLEASIALGAVKANTGHLGAAAGAVGIIKSVLSMQNRELVPIAGLVEPNPELPLAGGPFRLLFSKEAWDERRPLVAGVSSFGVGGTNAHAVIECRTEREPEAVAPRPQFLGWTARDLEDTHATAGSLLPVLAELADHRLGDLAATLAAARGGFAVRAAVAALDVSSARTAVERGEVTVHKPTGRPRVAFVFPGQGAQYEGMARGLHGMDPAFAADFEDTLTLLDELGSPARAVWCEAGASRLDQTDHTQPLLFAVEHALAVALADRGVRPDLVVGHSIGELVAAVVAGVMDKADGARLVLERGRLMGSMPAGGMLAIHCSEDDIVDIAARHEVDLAVWNAPGQVVAAGPQERLDELAAELAVRGIRHCGLATSHAFHSAQMDGAVAPFRRRIEQVQFSAPRIAFLSAVTGRLVDDEWADPGFWANQIRQPVRFDRAAALLSKEDVLVVEVGPGAVLTDLLKQAPGWPADRVMTTTLPRAGARPDDGADSRQFAQCLADLWVHGVSVERPHPSQRVPLPAYPLKRERHWVAPVGGEATPVSFPTSSNQVTATSKSTRLVASQTFDDRPADTGSPLSRLQWHEAPIPPTSISRAGRRHAIVVSASAEEATWMALRWVRAAGFDAREVRPAELADELGRNSSPLTVVHADGLVALPPADSGNLASQLELFHSLFGIIQTIQRHPSSQSLLVLTAQACNTSGDDVVHPVKAMLPALLRSLVLEEPGRRARLVDVGQQPDFLSVVAEIRAETPEVTAIRGDRRWVSVEAAVDMPDQLPFSRLRRRGSYVIFGGLGMIGLSVARAIADTGTDPTFVLVGRRTPQEAGREAAVADLKLRGAEVVTLAVDIGDPRGVRRALDLAKGLGSGLAGVIQAAGVPGGGLVVGRARESIDDVLAPKTLGTLHVLDALADGFHPDFVALFSSRAGSLGLVGSADYAGANAFLDALPAVYPQLPLLSVGWGAWAGGGMARRADAPPLAAGQLQPVPSSSRTWERPLTLAEDWVTDNHRIAGERVMPAAGWLDLLTSELFARERPTDATTLEFRDLVFHTPMVGRHASVRFVLDDASGSVTGGGLGEDGTWRLHVSARYSWSDEAPPRVYVPECPPTDVPVAGTVVGYGPRYQVLRGLAREEASITADVSLADDTENGGHMVHPALFDLATTVLQPGDSHVGRLPAVVDRLTIYGPLGRRVLSRLSVTSDSGSTLRADATLCGSDGRVLISAAGFTMRAVRNDVPVAGIGAYDPRLQSGEGLDPVDGGRLFCALLERFSGRTVLVRPFRDGHPVPLEDGAAIGSGLPLLTSRHPKEQPSVPHPPPEPALGEHTTTAPHLVPKAAIDEATSSVMTLDQIMTIIEGALGRPIGPDDDFFDAGGDSLVAIRLMAEIREVTGVDTGIGLLFAAPTPRQLLESVVAAR